MPVFVLPINKRNWNVIGTHMLFASRGRHGTSQKCCQEVSAVHYLLNNFNRFWGDDNWVLALSAVWKTNWLKTNVVNTPSPAITYYYPFKYKERLATSPVKEYNIVFRLAEQYLIRAEARAQLNNLMAAKNDLNLIRTRANLPAIIVNDKAAIMLAIEHERQIELFAEWGHRWFDLKRTNRSGSVLGPLKGSNWQMSDTLYPLPQVQLDLNVNLHQNPGY